MTKLSFVCLLVVPLCLRAPALMADGFTQVNLVSDIPGTAAFTDQNLKDPWGMSFSPTSPIWVSDRATGVSTLYNGAGAPQGGPLIVTIPPAAAATGPTGEVFAGGTNFRLNGSPVNFIFDTLGGTIDAWNGGAGTTAVVMATTPGANYTGLALASNTLYAANFKAGGSIDVFDATFTPTTLTGKFIDPNLPAGYAPFNVQNINGTLYVEYAKTTPGVPVALSGGGGYVDEFDASGNFIKRLVTNGPLNGPWGVAVVPSAGFGSFGAGSVLIGNFDNGQINVFDVNGNFVQTLTDANGSPLVNAGLWAIAFDPGVSSSGNAAGLYFAAGINGGNDGLFGRIDAVPEPSAWTLTALGLLGFAGFKRRRSLAK